MAWTVTFEDPDASLDAVGGKALNLSRLTRAGFPVPPGFVVTTDAFRAVLADPVLRRTIDEALAGDGPRDPGGAEAASAAIRAAFAATAMPAGVRAAVLHAYVRLGRGRVAVRSSATAEDLPDLSFAGQQDTLLDVEGESDLLEAVVTCWSSLFTARAISYRRNAGIADADVALAVAVQRMVPADAAGVLFTANPLTGHRAEMALDAVRGLGEALVSGQVTPDHYVADGRTGEVRSGSGSVLTPLQVRELVALGRRVQDEYGEPQDIEWAIRGDEVLLLQARAITSLYPVPEGAPADSMWLSFGSVQGFLAPITPLGRDALLCVVSGAAAIAGAAVDPDDNPWVRPAGDRLWVRIDRALRNPVGARVVPVLLGIGDPAAGAIVRELAREGLVAPLPPASLLAVAPRLFRAVRTLAGNLPPAVKDPVGLRATLDRVADDLVAGADRRLGAAAALPDPHGRAQGRARAVRGSLLTALPTLLPYAGAVIAAPTLALRVLGRLSGATGAGDHGVPPLVLEVTRSLPHNVTTEMDLALWRVAEAGTDRDAALARFLDAYGMRGVGEIDVGRPRWREDPSEVLAAVERYQDMPADQSPATQFAHGERAAAAAVERLAAMAARRPGGAARARLVRGLATRVRVLAGGRELPKFTLVRILGLARAAFLETGRDLVADGVLDRPDDVFFLRLRELVAVGSEPRLRERVDVRRRSYDRESRRARIPRVLLGDGRAYLDPPEAAAGGAVTGSPVSPGVAEGRVRVVHDPSNSGLRHGEVLVCPGTDPAWTPLFLSAAALVTEVGGMMTHGSVVAREYGIPAVVGVRGATTRLSTGQRVRVDGSNGTVVVLDEAPADASDEPTWDQVVGS